MHDTNRGENWILLNHVRHKLYTQSDVLLLPFKILAPAYAVVSQCVPSSPGSMLWGNDSCRPAAVAACATTGAPAWTHSIKSLKLLTLSSWVCLRTTGMEVVSRIMEAALYKLAGDEQRECYKYPGSLHPHPYTHNFPVKAGRYLWNVLTQRPAVSLLVKW